MDTFTAASAINMNNMHILMIKVKEAKQSCNRLGVAQRVPGGLGSQIFMTFGT
jgi:hypothetical protein